MPFPQAPAGARSLLCGWQWSGWLWCCGRSCWWCSRRMTKRRSPLGSGRGRRGPWEKGAKSYHSFWSQAWVSLDLWAGTEYCYHTQGLPPATWLHQGITTLFSTSRYTLVLTFKPTLKMWGWHDVALTWNHTKDHNRNRKLCFHHPGHVPVICGNPDLHFEGACNGPVVITWIGREHELYSGAWNLYTIGQLGDGLQQKKKTGFH